MNRYWIVGLVVLVLVGAIVTAVVLTVPSEGSNPIKPDGGIVTPAGLVPTFSFPQDAAFHLTQNQPLSIVNGWVNLGSLPSFEIVARSTHPWLRPDANACVSLFVFAEDPTHVFLRQNLKLPSLDQSRLVVAFTDAMGNGAGVSFVRVQQNLSMSILVVRKFVDFEIKQTKEKPIGRDTVDVVLEFEQGFLSALYDAGFDQPFHTLYKSSSFPTQVNRVLLFNDGSPLDRGWQISQMNLSAVTATN